jgi:hypothetical protein
MAFGFWMIACLSELGIQQRSVIHEVLTVSLLLIIGCAFFFAWPILRWLARRGRPKLVYYLAHASLLFPRTGETYAGATLLAALALAHRGNLTRAELDWVSHRLVKQKATLGVFGAAYAMVQALQARLARDEGRQADAAMFAERARILFGTLTYVSELALPKGVETVVYEYLALDDCRCGMWGVLEIAPEKRVSTIVRAFRGWAREHLGMGEKDKKAARARKRVASPLVESLYARPTEARPPADAREAHVRACRDFLALQQGRPIGPRATMNMLTTFDVLTHPEASSTLIPEAIRGDEAMVEALHEELAATLAAAILPRGAPIFSMDGYGPISARVYQRLEADVRSALSRALDELVDLAERKERQDAAVEWLLVSRARAAYRKLEFTLGPDAAAQCWPQMRYAYGKFGVLLSETIPRRRPLAHAVFKCLAREAERFNDAESLARERNNMEVTRGVA